MTEAKNVSKFLTTLQSFSPDFIVCWNLAYELCPKETKPMPKGCHLAYIELLLFQLLRKSNLKPRYWNIHSTNLTVQWKAEANNSGFINYIIKASFMP